MALGKSVKFRAKVTRQGDKFHIIIPKFYHKDITKNKYLGEIVEVEISPIPSEYVT